MLEALPAAVPVDPVEQTAVVGEIQIAEGLGGAEGRRLRTEIGAAHENGVHLVAHRGVNAREVTDGNVAVVGSSSNAAAFTPNPSTGPASFDTLINNVVAYTFGSQAQPGVPQPAPNVVGLGPLGTLVAPFGVPQTLSGFATSLIDTQSADVANTTTDLGTEQTVQTALQAQVSSTSGVNTDNELSNMVALQNSYGANARVIAAAQAMWTQLITSVS